MEKTVLDIKIILEKIKEKKTLSKEEIEYFLEKRQYFTTKEVSAIIDEPESTLRFWEDEYNIEIKRRYNNIKKRYTDTREYERKDIERLRDIKYMRREKKLTTDGAKDVLHSGKKIENERKAREILQEVLQEIKTIQKELNSLPTFTESVVID